jgi:plasmid maintenance system antidote protein VapI
MTLLGNYINKNYPGMKLTYIAEQSGMTKQRLHYLMNNENSKLTFEEACRMSKVLNVSMDALCKELSNNQGLESK